MNEIDWLSGCDPAAMLDLLRGRASDRKLRLFACACVRRFWSLLHYHVPRNAVLTAERLAEGEADAGAVEAARQQAEAWAANAPEFEQFAYLAAAATLADAAAEAATNARELARQQAVRAAVYELVPGENEAQAAAAASEAEGKAQVALLNELFGNPFRPARVEPHWLAWSGGAALAIAREVEQDQRFAELPYLADALTDAGCTDDALLRHLRRGEGHLRGCWALDLVLGREEIIVLAEPG